MKFDIYKSVRELGKSQWEDYVSKRFFLSYNYLLTLEEACPQLNYRYVICTSGAEFIGLCYFQIIPFSGQNLHKYLPKSNRLFKWLFENTLAKIDTDLLVLGNVIFTCENGVFIEDSALGNAEELIYTSLDKLYDSLGSKPMGTMISENIQTVSKKLFCPKQFHEFKVEDRMELNLCGMNSMEEYKQALQSKYRVRLNKVYKQNENTEVFEITAENFPTYRNDLETLFYNVLDNSKFKLTTISIDYFYEFLRNVDRFKMKGYRVNGDLMAFVSYFQLDSIIEVHYVGLDYDYGIKNKLYNYILFQMIEESYRLGVYKICYGRTAQELKSTLGAQPFSTLSSLKVNVSILNILTPIFLNRLVPESWIARSPFKNK